MNLDKLERLNELSESERYWLRSLNRYAERHKWSSPSYEPEFSPYFFLTDRTEFSDRKEQISAYVADALMVGLYTDEPILALRCFAQVQNYAGILDRDFRWGDARNVLQCKVEAYLRKE